MLISKRLRASCYSAHIKKLKVTILIKQTEDERKGEGLFFFLPRASSSELSS